MLWSNIVINRHVYIVFACTLRNQFFILELTNAFILVTNEKTIYFLKMLISQLNAAYAFDDVIIYFYFIFFLQRNIFVILFRYFHDFYARCTSCTIIRVCHIITTPDNCLITLVWSGLYNRTFWCAPPIHICYILIYHKLSLIDLKLNLIDF